MIPTQPLHCPWDLGHRLLFDKKLFGLVSASTPFERLSTGEHGAPFSLWSTTEHRAQSKEHNAPSEHGAQSCAHIGRLSTEKHRDRLFDRLLTEKHGAPFSQSSTTEHRAQSKGHNAPSEHSAQSCAPLVDRRPRSIEIPHFGQTSFR